MLLAHLTKSCTQNPISVSIAWKPQSTLWRNWQAQRKGLVQCSMDGSLLEWLRRQMQWYTSLGAWIMVVCVFLIQIWTYLNCAVVFRCVASYRGRPWLFRRILQIWSMGKLLEWLQYYESVLHTKNLRRYGLIVFSRKEWSRFMFSVRQAVCKIRSCLWLNGVWKLWIRGWLCVQETRLVQYAVQEPLWILQVTKTPSFE